MNRITAKFLFFVSLILFSSKTAFALDPHATGSAVITATVIGTTFDPPILISPGNNSTTTNSRPTLIWQRPSPLPATPLHHYDLYLDGQLFASSVSDTITNQSYYFYNIRRDNNTFYLELRTDLSQGYHTWSVTAYNNSGISASSETWTFYLDSTTPFIRLEKVDNQTFNWDTANPTSIPDINLRDISITNANPLLSGKVEPYANMQIILLCPQNILNCQNQTYQGNYPSGIWQHRFYNLIRGLVYTVHLSATDAAGNSVIFPEFYLAYGIITPTPIVKITPTTSPTITPPTKITPTISVTITPEPTPEIEIVPTPFIPVPPVSPTPPLIAKKVTTTPGFLTRYWYLILLVISLPVHLFMITYGNGIRFTLIFKFFFVLFFPFLGKKEYQTTPFTTLDMFNPEKLEKSWQSKVSDIKGFYGLTTPLLEKIFVKITCTHRHWKNIIINGNILPHSCLIPLLDDPKIPSNRLQTLSLKFHSLPLILAILTSSILLIISPNYFYLIYLYLSLQLIFSEFIYPKLSK